MLLLKMLMDVDIVANVFDVDKKDGNHDVFEDDFDLIASDGNDTNAVTLVS